MRVYCDEIHLEKLQRDSDQNVCKSFRMEESADLRLIVTNHCPHCPLNFLQKILGNSHHHHLRMIHRKSMFEVRHHHRFQLAEFEEIRLGCMTRISSQNHPHRMNLR